MPTQKKATAPDSYWVYHAKELQDLTAGPSDARFLELSNIMFNEDMEYIADVAAFCALPQPDFTNPSEADFISGAHIAQYKSIARAGAYFKLCEEV